MTDQRSEESSEPTTDNGFGDRATGASDDKATGRKARTTRRKATKKAAKRTKKTARKAAASKAGTKKTGTKKTGTKKTARAATKKTAKKTAQKAAGSTTVKARAAASSESNRNSGSLRAEAVDPSSSSTTATSAPSVVNTGDRIECTVSFLDEAAQPHDVGWANALNDFDVEQQKAEAAAPRSLCDSIETGVALEDVPPVPEVDDEPDEPQPPPAADALPDVLDEERLNDLASEAEAMISSLLSEIPDDGCASAVTEEPDVAASDDRTRATVDVEPDAPQKSVTVSNDRAPADGRQDAAPETGDDDTDFLGMGSIVEDVEEAMADLPEIEPETSSQARAAAPASQHGDELAFVTIVGPFLLGLGLGLLIGLAF